MSTFLCDINLGIAHTTYFDRFISITLNGIQSQIIINLKRRFCENWFPLKSLIDDHRLFLNTFCSHIEFMVCFCSILYSPHFYYISFHMLKILNNRFHHKIWNWLINSWNQNFISFLDVCTALLTMLHQLVQKTQAANSW